MTLKTLAVIEVIAVTLLTSGIAAIAASASSDNDKNDEDDYDLTGLITADSVNGECIGEYELTKDGTICVRAQEVDCNNKPNSSLCTGEKGRGGSVFCDEYAQLTGSRIAYGGCYDRNDNPRSYCDKYALEEAKQDWNWFCEAVCNNYKDVIARTQGCDNFIRCEGSSITPFCVDKETYCSTELEDKDVEYCRSDRDDLCQEQINGSRCITKID